MAKQTNPQHMLLSNLFLFALSAFAFKPKSPSAPTLVAQNELCNISVNYTYWVVGDFTGGKRANQFIGYNFTDAQGACEFFGLRLANITHDQLPEIWNMCTSCGFGAQNGVWIDVYESLEPPFGCWSIRNGYQVMSSAESCANDVLFAICQVPDDVVVPYPTFTSTTLQTTSTSTSTETFYTTSTTLITDYEFIRVTSTITEGTYTVTCTTSTKTIVHTVTKRVPHHHHDHHSSSSSSSSSFWNKSRKPQPQKVQKGPTAPDIFVACTASINNFYFVQNMNPGDDATAQDACDAIGYPVANVTLPILVNLVDMFSDCAIGVNGAGAGFWYSYQPQGCLIVNEEGVLFVETTTGPAYGEYCLDQQWVLCRAGPPVITTTTVQTNSFTTLSPSATTTITETSLSIIPESESTTSTITETSAFTTVILTNLTSSTLTTTNSTKTLTKTKTKCTTTTKCQRC